MAITDNQSNYLPNVDELLEMLKQIGVKRISFVLNNRYEADTYEMDWNENKQCHLNKLKALSFLISHFFTFFFSKSTLNDTISKLSDSNPTQDNHDIHLIILEHLRHQQRCHVIATSIESSLGMKNVSHESFSFASKSKTIHFEGSLYESVSSVSLTMQKSVILMRRGVTNNGQSEVCLLLNPGVSFPPKRLQMLFDAFDSAVKSLTCSPKDHFDADEVKALSGRTPLVTKHTHADFGKSETVFIVNDEMRSEQRRHSSFVYWPLPSITNVQELVEAGFYSTDDLLQIVGCFSCGLSLRVSELNGRSPLDVHRERSQHCQFLLSENIRERAIDNTTSTRFTPFTINSIDVNGVSRNQISHLSSPISKTYNEIDYASNESDISNRLKRQNTIERRVEEVAEKMQNDFSLTQQRQSNISQPSDDVEDGTEILTNLGGKFALSGTDQNPRILPHFRPQYNPQGDVIVSDLGSANNDGHLHEQTEGATASVSNFVPSPSSFSQNVSTPPPRNPFYEQDEARRESFNAWNGRHDIGSLVEAGLFYTGDQDIVRCYHCDIGLAEWNREDDPWQEHARHSHECHFLLQIKGHAYVSYVQREWSKVYSPKRPDLSDVNSRLDTFHNWPTDFVVQTPQQLATAGFYYAGMTDTVRCHYCDGGLREWEPGDIPWVEHAKWFPHCKFVLKIKGLPFIQQCVARRNEVLEDPVPNNPQAENEALNRLRAPISNEEKNRAEEENNPLCTAAAQAIIDMGYTTSVVTKCINSYIASTGQRNFSATDLMKIILDKEDEDGKLSNGEEGNIKAESDFRYDGPALVKINESLRQVQLCIECRSRARHILFQPCGHYLLCNVCAVKCTRCVRCDTRIESKTKIYLS